MGGKELSWDCWPVGLVFLPAQAPGHSATSHSGTPGWRQISRRVRWVSTQPAPSWEQPPHTQPRLVSALTEAPVSMLRTRGKSRNRYRNPKFDHRLISCESSRAALAHGMEAMLRGCVHGPCAHPPPPNAAETLPLLQDYDKNREKGWGFGIPFVNSHITVLKASVKKPE